MCRQILGVVLMRYDVSCDADSVAGQVKLLLEAV